MQCHAQGFGDPMQGSEAGDLVAGFELAEVFAGEFGMVGEHDLRPAFLRPQDAYAPSHFYANIGCHLKSMAVC